jgi:hypothetical protein
MKIKRKILEILFGRYLIILKILMNQIIKYKIKKEKEIY